jgi:4-hydroxybenzoate polyprenyltransferase
MTLGAVWRSLRPSQWTKNLFVFAALIFSREALSAGPALRVAAAFFIFCVLSGATYLFNDARDAEEDRRHPVKSRRPVAAGLIRPGQALAVAAALAGLGTAAAFALDLGFGGLAAAYLALQAAYTLCLRNVVILDVFVVASGFVLRIAAGGLVIGVRLSSWLLVCATLLALFLALGKRRSEIVLLETRKGEGRPVLLEYSVYLLDQMIAVVTASTVLAYGLYTMSEETVRRFGTADLVYTTPFVLFGVFRYLYLVHRKGEGGSPDELIVRDAPLAAAIVLWIAAVGLILYVL